jgi:hypothetical protein
MVESAMVGWALLIVDRVCLVKGLETVSICMSMCPGQLQVMNVAVAGKTMFDQKIGFVVKSAAIYM